MSATQEEIAVERLQEWIRELLILFGRDPSSRIRLLTLGSYSAWVAIVGLGWKDGLSDRTSARSFLS
jgi:hypothetical protein